MRLKKTEFDLIVSLGGNCSTALQLKHRGLRKFALPLDWTLMEDVKPIELLPEMLQTGFARFLRWENAVQARPPRHTHHTLSHQIRDSYSGWVFTHHFMGNRFSQEMFEQVRAVMQRRIDRFYEKASKAGSVLFILETAFAYEDGLVQNLFHALQGVWPSKDIYLVVMEFSAPEQGEQWLHDGHLVIAKYQRPHNIVYDNQFTSHEWHWMDSLRISGLKTADEKRRTERPIKWIFKVWRSVGKWLEEKGAGVIAVRFRDYRFYTLREELAAEEALRSNDGDCT